MNGAESAVVGSASFFGEHADIRRGSFQPAELTLILTFGIRA